MHKIAAVALSYCVKIAGYDPCLQMCYTLKIPSLDLQFQMCQIASTAALLGLVSCLSHIMTLFVLVT